jgi:hypothetical protein
MEWAFEFVHELSLPSLKERGVIDEKKIVKRKSWK